MTTAERHATLGSAGGSVGDVTGRCVTGRFQFPHIEVLWPGTHPSIHMLSH